MPLRRLFNLAQTTVLLLVAASLQARTSITQLDAALPVQPSVELPDLNAAESAPGLLPGRGTVQVTRIDITGNSILGEELMAVAQRYTGRSLSAEDLRQLQDELTLVYVRRGYLTSGATLTALSDTVLQVSISEGRLESIRATTDGRARPQHIAAYLESFGPLQPVNAYDIERRLQALQSEAYVERIDARLLPAEQRGESILAVQTHEAPPLRARVEANNYQTPAVGAWSAQAGIGYHNALGVGDDFDVAVRNTEGLWEVRGYYDVPIRADGSRAQVYGSALHSKIVSGPFADLNIKADSDTAGLKFVHPLSRDPANLLSLSIAGEWWRSKTYLLGSGFSFVEGPDDGVGEAVVARMGADWRKRGARSVLAASWHISVGLDAPGTTQSHGDAPDGQFVSTTLRAQWAQRLGILNSQLISRFDAQFANAALLGMEQMTLGGRWSVRGYRENTLIRDNGVIGSLEWRVPLWTEANGRVVLETGPFVDLSYSWNTDRGEIGPKELNSIGMGMHWRPLDRVHFELYWGYELEDIDYPGNDALQDAGVHMGIEVQM